MCRSLWLLLLCCCVLTAWGATPPESLRRLEQADRALEQAERNPARAGALAREAAAQLPADACPALAEARANPSEASIARARQELRALRGAVGLESRSGPSGAQAGAALSGVLARGEFSSIQPGKFNFRTPEWIRKAQAAMNRGLRAVGRFFAKIWGWFARLMGRVFSKWHYTPTRINSMGKGIRYTLITVIVLGVLLLLGFLFNRLLVYWQLSNTRKKQQAGNGETMSGERVYTTPWDLALTSAEACWARGEQREALRMVMRACLGLLDGRGVLRYDESRANGEVLRELRRLGRSELHGPMRVIVRAFDRGWYGFLAITGDEFATVLDTSRQLRTTLTEER